MADEKTTIYGEDFLSKFITANSYFCLYLACYGFIIVSYIRLEVEKTFDL